jgi:UDP-hydrolysing UDP-N-acetyl-D-glucosamine 2-epimerase
MASIHLTSAEPYRNRLIRMGEEPERAFNVGALGLDNIKKSEFYGFELLNLSPYTEYFVVTYHPVTKNSTEDKNAMANMLRLFEKFGEYKFIITLPNLDHGNEFIRKKFLKASRNNSNVSAFPSLGNKLYLSALNYSRGVIGNSSSGVIEAPFLGIPTVNIGSRQEGRIRSSSIIDCDPDFEQLLHATSKAINYSPDQTKRINPISLLGDGTASLKIADILETTNIKDLKQKKFFDASNFYS